MHHSHINTLYRQALRDVLELGVPSKPRGVSTKEILGAHYHLRFARYNILNSPARALNYQFSVAEWLWIQLGFNAADMIVPYNKGIERYANPLTGTFDGAYGPQVVQQLPYVLEKLFEDPDSRQAVITIWKPRPRQSLDIPCTVSLQFLQREGELHLIVNMRSNDAWLGMPYDIFNFTQLQNYTATLLGLHVGEYHHFVGSLHLYETDFHKADKVVQEESNLHLMMDQTHSPPLSPMPKAFRSFYHGLTLMGYEMIQNNVSRVMRDESIMRWINPQIPHLDPVWGNYLKLLATRFMSTWPSDWLEFPYTELVPPRKRPDTLEGDIRRPMSVLERAESQIDSGPTELG